MYQNNKMENLFVEYKENKWYMFPLFLILMIGTFGFAWFFLYDDFHERKYMVNRRRLIKAIKNGEVTLVKRLPADPDYFFDIDIFYYDLNYPVGIGNFRHVIIEITSRN